MADKTKHFACPDCGDDRHLYGKADCCWNPDTRAWEATSLDKQIECTSCDWEGWVEEAEAAAK